MRTEWDDAEVINGMVSISEKKRYVSCAAQHNGCVCGNRETDKLYNRHGLRCNNSIKVCRTPDSSQTPYQVQYTDTTFAKFTPARNEAHGLKATYECSHRLVISPCSTVLHDSTNPDHWCRREPCQQTDI